MFKAEQTADQAAPRAVGTRGSSACVGAMQSTGDRHRLSLRSTGEVLIELGMEEQP